MDVFIFVYYTFYLKCYINTEKFNELFACIVQKYLLYYGKKEREFMFI